jgi:HPt (histidine-containing phosphotransfer) domain-containing protein
MTAAPDANVQPPIINWEAATEQCGGDEEFLIELLGDLWQEISEQMAQLQQLIAVPEPNFRRLSQLSHAIKGAAANLMCNQLRESALKMEVMANQMHEKATSGGVEQSGLDDLRQSFASFQVAVARFRGELVQLGIEAAE